jgi:glycosyltransferase involved in cell wall biosynthesis
MRIETMRRIGKPLVWTLHDMWAFTGGCHYAGSCEGYQARCGACPQLRSGSPGDLSRRIWRRKERAWGGLPMVVVTPSRWLARCAERSSLFRERRVEVIPYGLDLDRFRPVDRSIARSILALPQDKRLILFGAMSSTSDERKGFRHLAAAMKALAAEDPPADTELVVFGASRPAEPPELGFPVHYLGHLHDDISLALVYAAADLFVAPSTEDNLPNTVMEATACGTPTVAFDIGGMPDLVEPDRTGYLARPFDDGELAFGIRTMLGDREALAARGAMARAKAEREFPRELQARRYAALYGELCTPGGRADVLSAAGQ